VSGDEIISSMNAIKQDPLSWVDDAYREERKRERKPTEQQSALASHLESLGNWQLFLTGTFRPNKFESFVHQEGEKFVPNQKVSWVDPENRILKRVDRSGGHHYGMRDPAPGWSAHVCERQMKKFLRWTPLRKTRWFYVVEGHKHRACAHWHALMANTGHIDLKCLDDKWDNKFGRMGIELVKEELGVAHYLAKGYVAKSYGKDTDIKFGYSNNCKRPIDKNDQRLATHAMVFAHRNEKRGLDGTQWKQAATKILTDG